MASQLTNYNHRWTVLQLDNEIYNPDCWEVAPDRTHFSPGYRTGGAAGSALIRSATWDSTNVNQCRQAV